MKLFKITLLAICFMLLQNVKGSHFTGGYIEYESLGNNNYKLYLYLYRDVSGISMPNAVNAYACSPCFSTQSIQLILDSVFTQGVPTSPCIDQNAPGTLNLELYKYSSQVFNLPGVCSQYKFTTQVLSGRNGAIDNLSSIYGLQLEAHLYDTIANNSSKVMSNIVQSFCVNQNAKWRLDFQDPDADSLKISLVAAKGSVGSSNCSPNDYNYTPGFSASQPIRTKPNHPIVINQKKQYLKFIPNFVEVDIVVFKVEEYRFDTILSQWKLVGSALRDVVTTIVSTCKNDVLMGPRIDYDSFYQDSLTSLQAKDLKCDSTQFEIGFKNSFDCSTFSPDGTDFFILNESAGNPFVVDSMRANCNAQGLADKITFYTSQGFPNNGRFQLSARVGFDGNTLLNECGYALSQNEKMIFNVYGCNGVSIDEQNVLFKFTISPNPVEDFAKVNLPENGEFELQVYDLSGRKIMVLKNVHGTTKLDCSNLANGTYLLVAKSVKGGQQVKKVIIK